MWNRLSKTFKCTKCEKLKASLTLNKLSHLESKDHSCRKAFVSVGATRLNTNLSVPRLWKEFYTVLWPVGPHEASHTQAFGLICVFSVKWLSLVLTTSRGTCRFTQKKKPRTAGQKFYSHIIWKWTFRLKKRGRGGHIKFWPSGYVTRHFFHVGYILIQSGT